MLCALVPLPLAFLPLFSRGSVGSGEDFIGMLGRGAFSLPPFPPAKFSGPLVVSPFHPGVSTVLEGTF